MERLKITHVITDLGTGGAQQMLVNLLTAPLFVLFFLALFVPWANAAGAWLGLLASIATAVAIAYSQDLGLNLGVSFVWMMPCSLLVGITVGTVGSALATIFDATERT